MEKINIESTYCAFDENEVKVIKECLAYCSHRLRKHKNSGIEGRIDIDDIDFIRQGINEIEE